MNDLEVGGLVAANDNSAYRFYVYAWQYPDARPFYVGKGVNNRDVEPKKHNPFFVRTVAKIRREGGEPRVVRWHKGLLEDDAFKLERAYIKLFGRRNIGTGVLCNLTDGGEGTSGWVPNAETRARLSKVNSGYVHTPEARAKMRAANVGRKHSAETRAKISASHVGITHSDESRAKMREAKLGKTPSDSTRAKLSAARRGKPKSAEHRKRIGDAQRGKEISAVARARVSDARRRNPPKTGFKGVSINRGKWRASIKVSGRSHHLGTFLNPEDAARAYDDAVTLFWGPGPWYRNFGDADVASA